MKQNRTFRLRSAALVAAAVLLPACDLSVTNPGAIPDADLNTPAAVPGLVTGMSADLSVAIGSLAMQTAIMADELFHSGNYANERVFNEGIIRPENVNTYWAYMHRARWVAEQGLERMKAIQGYDFETNVLTVRAYLYAGFANRLLGENVCECVIDGGGRQEGRVHFERAEQQFSEALRQAQGVNNATFINAARAGRASVRAALGDWSGAVEDAALVPTTFRFDAIFSTNSSRESNDLAYETVTRREFTVFNTPWAAVRDPRASWDTVKTSSGALQKGQDGRTTFFRQTKYRTLDSPITLARGTEMLLLRAEAALRSGDANAVDTAMGLINQARAAAGLAGVTAATPEEAWPILHRERGAVLWLEARRFFDLRRWHAESGPAHHPFLTGRDKCIPISQNELYSNKNL